MYQLAIFERRRDSVSLVSDWLWDFILLLIFGLALPAFAEPKAADIEFFENRVRPVLVERCYDCHSAKAAKLKGGFQLDSRDGLLRGGDSGVDVIPGDPQASRLIQAVRHANQDIAMPRGLNGPVKLPDSVIQDLTRWVQMGAPYPVSEVSGTKAMPDPRAHWSFRPLYDPGEPEVRDTAWLRTSIDRFVLAKLESVGQKPVSAADRRTLIRRATFDLTGLPPTLAEIDDFVADTNPDAFSRVVDRLLDSPRYGEQWGRHWLDVVRYADTAGETADYPVPSAWHYRNYVIDAFNADKPYDEFLKEQIAGDIMARTGPRDRYAERVAATGYIAISRRFGFDSENYHHLTIQDTIDTLGQSVLGLTLGCARCHAHKFDPISTPDYYALYGIFESTRYAFPGSEQKQKYRALVPLAPPEEVLPKWRDFESRVAVLSKVLDRAKLSGPSVVLRSLDDLDGDFEMQAPAAGGSKGVLVAPWVDDGPISVTMDAQSPYKNLYPSGKVGASLPPGTNAYYLTQALHPRRSGSSGEVVYINLDFRVATNDAVAQGNHRFWLGSASSGPALEVLIGADSVAIREAGKVKTLRKLRANEWQNLQLAMDLKAGTIRGRVGVPGDVVEIPERSLSREWNGGLDQLGFDSVDANGAMMPGLALDNLAVQDMPIPPVCTVPPAVAAFSGTPDSGQLTERLQQLAGLDGDFELQSEDAPPSAPWGPGPHSIVKIQHDAQSPFRNIFGAGRLGVHLPNSGAYNGFGQTLTNRWQSGRTGRLYASFDFRIANVEAGSGGTWRFYLGHGPGNSTAIELFMNGSEFFRRSGDAREMVGPLKIGEWYQVQVSLDLEGKSYTGTIVSASDRREFAGLLASGWDGSIDYTFIDSYGHVNGVKPALDADNFAIGETPLPPVDSAAVQIATGETESRRAKVAEVRRQLAELSVEGENAKRELETLLANGPVELTYAVSEGTPRNARIQLRGEPDRPGDEVPRGFLKVLGGRPLPKDTPGSGRLELANWLVSPENPLTARVMANRIWQYHFNEGLVKTPNDFGARGLPPTNPALLDHLATQFIRSGWSIKAMHRLIMLSATYQQQSPVSDAGVAKLGLSSLDTFSPFVRRRLSAEETRDAILFDSGALDLTPGREHPFPAPTGWGYTQHGPFSAVYDHHRRSIYLMTQRIKRHPFLALFDGADPNASTGARRTTTVPTQALFFLNDPFVHTNAERLAARVLAEDSSEPKQILRAYRLVLGRSPTETENADAMEFLAACRDEFRKAGNAEPEKLSLAALARVLFGSNEFLTVD